MNQVERINKAEKVVKAALELKGLYDNFPDEPTKQAKEIAQIAVKQQALWVLLEPFEEEAKPKKEKRFIPFHLLPTRIANLLQRSEITTLDQLEAMTDDELFKVRQVGHGSVVIIRNMQADLKGREA